MESFSEAAAYIFGIPKTESAILFEKIQFLCHSMKTFNRELMRVFLKKESYFMYKYKCFANDFTITEMNRKLEKDYR